MKKWIIASVIPPELINPAVVERAEEERKLLELLEGGFEPFAVMRDRIWLRKSSVEKE